MSIASGSSSCSELLIAKFGHLNVLVNNASIETDVTYLVPWWHVH